MQVTEIIFVLVKRSDGDSKKSQLYNLWKSTWSWTLEVKRTSFFDINLNKEFFLLPKVLIIPRDDKLLCFFVLFFLVLALQKWACSHDENVSFTACQQGAKLHIWTCSSAFLQLPTHQQWPFPPWWCFSQSLVYVVYVNTGDEFYINYG